MEKKTKVEAETGSPCIHISRTFDLPVEWLFKAYTEADLLSQWMGTNVLKLENRQFGGYTFETLDGEGNMLFGAYGCIHEYVLNEKIVRTFEMKGSGFEAQLEFIQFAAVDSGRSRLHIQIVFRSAALRDQQLKLPFAYGINMAHDRLQQVYEQLT